MLARKNAQFETPGKADVKNKAGKGYIIQGRFIAAFYLEKNNQRWPKRKAKRISKRHARH